MKIKAKINGDAEVVFTPNAKNNLSGMIGERGYQIEKINGENNKLVVIGQGKKYEARLLSVNVDEKTMVLKVNGNRFMVQLTDEYDELLKSLGMDAASAKKVNELKAPMPGVVIDVVVAVGDTVAKDDPLVVLEAMKMENMLKSPADGVISSINIEKGDTVEKNKVLVNFE